MASLGTKVPQRDIKVRVDNGDEMVTPWSGEIEVPDNFKRITQCAGNHGKNVRYNKMFH